MTPYTSSFSEAMNSLLRHLRIDTPPEPRHEVYTLRFDGECVLYCLSSSNGLFDVLADAGVLPNKQAWQTLCDILGQNRPPVAVQLERDSGSLIVWGQAALVGMTPQQSLQLVQQVRSRMQAVRGCLGKGGRPVSTGGLSSSALLQMARSVQQRK